MKVTVRNEPGFKPVKPGSYMVEIDGKTVDNVYRVDTDAGIAWVAETDDDGNLVIDYKEREVVEKKVFGQIRLIPMKPKP